LVFYKARQSNPGFELFSQLFIAFLLSNQETGFSNLGFKTQVFNSQFLTQTDISFFRISNFKPKNGYFLVYFNKSNIVDLKVVDIGFVGDSILHEQNLPE
jgi:hypothetical protein